MILLTDQPKLTDLHRLIEAVPSFPIKTKQLIQYAIANDYPDGVVEFYRTFPPEELFINQDDLFARTEALEIMLTENPPAEDNVHGAED